MKKFKVHNLEHIKNRFEQETGVSLKDSQSESISSSDKLVAGSKLVSYFGRNKTKLTWVACLTLCLIAFGAFGFAKFTSLAGDEVAFESAYVGEGVVKVLVSNYSDKPLNLEKHVKLSRWSTGEEVAGDVSQIVYSDMEVSAKTQKEVTIDLSQAYDVEALESVLPEDDWYYLTLTNNNFAFGQDWMCSVDFQKIEATLAWEDKETKLDAVIEVVDSKKEEYAQVTYTAPLAFAEWIWPTESESVTTTFGNPRGESLTGETLITDHINIRGEKGDPVYAVADAVVLGTGFDATYGYYVILDLGEGLTVKYGHLSEILVEAEEAVNGGAKIAKLGATGMATGPNLAFFVYQDGEPVNPLATEDDM